MTSPDAFLVPNLITYCRILAIPLFLFLLLSCHPVFAAVVFLVIALSDAVDGFVARRLGQITDLGKFLDPIADKILALSALVALVEMRSIGSLPVILIIIRDLLVSAVRLRAAKEGRVISASPWGKIKTVMQMAAILMLILDLPYAAAMLWLAVLLTLLSGVDYVVRKQ